MYQEKLVCAVKHNDRVLREHGDTVHLPFGSEYTLHFKNLNSVRALVRVSVDGQDATKNTSLIVPANGTVDLERFLDASNLKEGHRFKFIERTKKIEDGPRGIGAEDGLIRIEFEFEKQPAKIVQEIKEEVIRRSYIDEYRYWPRYTLWNGSPIYAQSATLTSTAGLGDVTCSANSLSAAGVSGEPVVTQAYNMSASAQLSQTMDSFYSDAGQDKVESLSANDVGITVKGSVSDQSFSLGAWFPTDGQKHVMVIKLLGQVGEKKVEKPVTVKTKQECPTCGTTNKHGTKFCRECGTSLTQL